MKYQVILYLFLLQTAVFGQADQTEEKDSSNLRFISSVTMQYERYYPFTEEYEKTGVHRYKSAGLTMEFWNVRSGIFRMYQRLGGAFGSKLYKDVIADIDFDVDKSGGLNTETMRFSTYIGPVLAIEPVRYLMIGVPLHFSARYIKDRSYFYLDNNQGYTADELTDFAKQHELVLTRNWMPGFRTGIEFTLFPEEDFSIIGSYNFNWYGGRDVYNMSQPPNYTNDVIMGATVNYNAPIKVANSSETSFSIGLRMYFRKKENLPEEKV